MTCETKTLLDLKNPGLFKQQAYIAGRWVESDTGAKLTVFNPATQQILGTVPNLNRQEVQQAITAADQAQQKWRTQTAKQRATILLKWRDLVLKNQADLALIMTLEQGKPLVEAMGEISYAASFIEWFAEEGKRVYGDTIPSHSNTQRTIVLKEPIGVCSAITPWNFPSAMITRKVSPALAAGCTMIVKPAEATPFSALALAVLAEEAGLPAGVLNIVTGEPQPIGLELTQNPLIRKFSFTGSTKIGKQLMAQCATTVKKLSLELGGNAPFIVFEDADLDKAVAGAIQSKFRNAGQVCICSNRFYVQDSILERFTTKFIAAVNKLKVGSGLESDNQIGPLINEAAVEKIELLLQQAQQQGAVLRTGGKRCAEGALFFEPTIVTNVTNEMALTQLELFGPVAPIIAFSSEAEVLTAANATEYGLAAYIYSQNINRIWRCAEALEYGMVALNSGTLSSESAPFGGVKQSGMGREGSHYGMDDYLVIKYLNLDLS